MMDHPKASRRTAGVLPVAVLGATLAGACTEGPSADGPPLPVRDSAGVEIVENDTALWGQGEGWRIAEEPSLHVGAAAEGDPALQFARIVGVHRLASGGIAVVDSWAPAVAFLDGSGTLVGRFDRVGPGPGELPSGGSGPAIQASFDCGADTVYVVVARNVAAYAAPGEHVRTFSLDTPGSIRSCTGGRLVAQRPVRWRQEPGTFTDSALLAVHDLEGRGVGELGTLPVDERIWLTGPEGTGYGRVAFGRSLSIHARDGLVATGFGDAFLVELREDGGALRRIVRVQGRDRAVGEADIERFRDFVMSPYRGNERELRSLEEQLEAARGRNLPAFAELHVDRAGNVWARAYDHLDAVAFYDHSAYSPAFEPARLEGPRRWVVLRADGRYLGEVAMPERFEVHEIADDHVLGVWRDELDIDYVREYPILKPGGAP